MAKKEHNISTQAIAAVGYSLSALLLAFAAALYMGWLPANGGQSGAPQQQAEKPSIPVVKSPERPPKKRVTDLPEEDPEPKPLPETAEREVAPAPLPAEEPEVPQEEPKIVEEPPQAEPVLPKSARIAPREHHTPEAYPLEDPAPQPLAEEPEDTKRLAETETSKPEELKTAQEDSAEPTPEKAQQDLAPPGREPSETAEGQPEAEEQTALAPGGEAPKPKPEEPVIAEEATPKVRIIAPPAPVAPVEQSPSVVIRIPPRAEDKLDELPPPIAVPRGKPKIVERPPQAAAQADDKAQRPAVPRAKPVQPQDAEPPAPPKPKVVLREPAPQPLAPRTPAPRTPAPKTPAPKTDVLAEEAEDDPAVTEALNVPRPQAKPKRLVKAPTQTATVTPLPRQTTRVDKKVKRTQRAKVFLR